MIHTPFNKVTFLEKETDEDKETKTEGPSRRKFKKKKEKKKPTMLSNKPGVGEGTAD